MAMLSPELSWTGEFLDPEMERTYVATSSDEARILARLCIVATTITSLAFVPLDILTLTGERLAFFLADRLVIAIICVVAMVALARARSYSRIAHITYIQQFTFFTANALVFNHPILERHGGALLPLAAIALFAFLPGGFRPVAVLCAYAPAISLYFWGVARPHPETPADLAIIAMMIVIAYAVGGFARTRFNHMRRTAYLHIGSERRINQALTEAKEAAEAGSRAKATFLAVMSHEIRTPMNGVLGMVRLVLDSDLPQQERHRLETACQSAEGLLTILDDILDISKLDAGPVSFETAPFDLRRTLDGVTALMTNRAGEKGLSFVLETSPDLRDWVAGDVARLRQILFNLTGNAIKFTHAGAVRLRVSQLSATDTDVKLLFEVIDTGIGIPQQHHDRIFQTFAQADATINRRFGGTGLGLAISKKLVDAMGGRIDFDSVPGRGSRFHVILSFEPAEPTTTSKDVPTSAVRPLSVLIAEDNVVNREVAKAYLTKAGHSATMVENGAKAVELAAIGGVDLILMDMLMPEVDGLEATQRIRALPAPKGDVPIIALTANAMHSDVARCRAAGMDAHIAKPMTQESLTAAIARVMGERTSQRIRAIYSYDVLLVPGDLGPLSEQLRSLGHRPFLPATREAALTMLTARPFDMVVLPGNAIDMATAVRQASERHGSAAFILAIAPLGPPIETTITAVDQFLPHAPADDDLAQVIAAHFPAGAIRDSSEDLVSLLGQERVNHLRALLNHTLRDERTALLRPDLTITDLANVAHRVRGSAGNLGLTALSEAAAAVMRAATTSDTAPITLAKAREELHAAINTAIVAFESTATTEG